jgi:hypothetical protein
LDKNELSGLIEALCDAPLDGGTAPSAELLALRREAAKVLAEAGSDALADSEALTAALAAVLSGSASEAAHKALAELASRSAAVSLEAESALAFVEATEQSAKTAPAHLVEEIFETEAAASPRAAAPSVWSRIADGLRPARAYRIATACSVVLLASAATWSLYWREGEHFVRPAEPAARTDNAAPALAPPAPVAKPESMQFDSTKAGGTTTESDKSASVKSDSADTEKAKTQSTKTEGTKTESTKAETPTPAIADVPAAPKPSLAARQPCEPRARALEAQRTRGTDALKTRRSVAAADQKADAGFAGSGCDFAPADDADAAIKQAREEAERARLNAAAPASVAPSSSAVGAATMQAAPAQGDPAATVFGRVRPPAATAPAAAPAARMREPSR